MSEFNRFDDIDPTHVKPGMTEALRELEESFGSLESELSRKPDPTYADVIEEMEAILTSDHGAAFRTARVSMVRSADHRSRCDA